MAFERSQQKIKFIPRLTPYFIYIVGSFYFDYNGENYTGVETIML